METVSAKFKRAGHWLAKCLSIRGGILLVMIFSYASGFMYGRIDMTRDCRQTGYHELLNHYFVCDVWWDKAEMDAHLEDSAPEEIRVLQVVVDNLPTSSF